MSLINLSNYFNKNKVTDTEKIIYEIIVKESINIINLKVSEIAKMVPCSHSTISKFVKKIGYDSWNAFIYSVVFEEKIKSQNNMDSIFEKINLEIENTKLVIRTELNKVVEKIVKTLNKNNFRFIFYGKSLTGNVAQYITWIFTKQGLFATHTYFSEELWGLINSQSIVVAFKDESNHDGFIDVISKCRQKGVKVITITTDGRKEIKALSHITLFIKTLGYFKNNPNWGLIQNEVLRFVGISIFEQWFIRNNGSKKIEQ